MPTLTVKTDHSLSHLPFIKLLKLQLSMEKE